MPRLDQRKNTAVDRKAGIAGCIGPLSDVLVTMETAIPPPARKTG